MLHGALVVRRAVRASGRGVRTRVPLFRTAENHSSQKLALLFQRIDLRGEAAAVAGLEIQGVGDRATDLIVDLAAAVEVF